MTNRRAVPGLESFWETCDKESVTDHPLMRELCHRLDTIQRYRTMISDAEDMGDDEAVELLSRQFEEQHAMVARLRAELTRIDEARG